MKALIWHGDRDLRIEHVHEPELEAGQTLLRVVMAGICGSDLHGYRGHPGPRVPPLILGHEAVGRADGHPGLVIPFPLWSCGACPTCQRGDVQLCAERGLLGLDRPGVFAEAVAVPSDALIDVPASMTAVVATLTEPLAVAVSALRLDSVTGGERVLVLGAGPIGLLTAYAATAAGAEVDVLEPLERRRNIAAALGAQTVYAEPTAVPIGHYDIAYDTVGIEPVWTVAISAVRRGGIVTVIGLGQDVGAVAIGGLVRNAITIRGHYAYTRDDFDAALDLHLRHPLDHSWVDSGSLDDGGRAFHELVETPDVRIKFVLEIDY